MEKPNEILKTEVIQEQCKALVVYKYRIIEKVQYRDLISIESLQKGLDKTKSGVSPGLDGETKFQITRKRLEKLGKDLASQTYKPTPAKKVGIPRPDGGTRYLGIASQIDKVVQGALLLKLEPILEKEFLDVSYGFRPGLGCHDALKNIKYQWKAITWVINMDISKCFDKINHEFLLKRLEKYCDQATIELIRKMLKVGYVDIHNLNSRAEYNTVGTPQGSLISPILCNLYLHELDLFVCEILRPLYNRGEARPNTEEYSKRRNLSDFENQVLIKYPELKGALSRVKHNRYVTGDKRRATDSFDPGFRRLHYIRYADDFILGFIGPKIEAETIKEAIKGKLREMKLEINADKSNIFHSSDKGINYLGAYMRYFSQNKVKARDEDQSSSGVDKMVNKLHGQAINTVHFRVPVDKILQRLVDKGFGSKRKDGTVRGTSLSRLCMMEDSEIVNRFSAIIWGLQNYYSFVNHRSDLWKVFAILRKSCALTLGQKHKVNSAARVFAKYGPELKIRDNLGKLISKLEYPTSLKTKIDFKTGKRGTQVSDILEAMQKSVQGSTKTNLKTSNKCEYDECTETEHLEAHHLNPISGMANRKDLTSFQKALISRSRKVVMLCKKHYNEVHRKGLLVAKPKVSKEIKKTEDK